MSDLIDKSIPRRKGRKGSAPANEPPDAAGQLQSVLDTAVDGIVIIDDRGVVTTFNRAASQMFGYQPAEVIGQRVNLLMPQPFRDGHDGYLSRYLSTGTAKIIGIGREVVGLRKNGTTFPIELAVSEVRRGTNKFFTGIIRDASHRKRLEKTILDVSEREQRLIGKELHDGVCQELAGIAYLMNNLHLRAKAGEPIAEETVGEVAYLLRQAIKHGRALARSLQPVEQLPNGLVKALGQLAADTVDTFTVQCRFLCPKPVQLRDQTVATHLFRIAQASVRNAVQHSRVKRLHLTLKQKPESINLVVRDDGFRAPGAPLFVDPLVQEMIEHRAKVIGARILLDRIPSGGGCVTCQIPQHKAA